MRNLRLKYGYLMGAILILFYAISFAQVDSLKSAIQIQASADKFRLPLNESLNYTVIISWQGEVNRFFLFPLKPPECNSLEIQGSSTTVETKKEMGVLKTYKKYNFVLKPTKQGQGLIGAVSLNYIDTFTQDSSSVSTQELKVQIDPAKKSLKLTSPIIVVVSSVILLVFLIFFGIYAKRTLQKKAKEKLPEIEKPKSLENIFEEKLKSISETLDKNETNKFFEEFYKLVLNYLEEKYQINLKGKTKDQLLSFLANLNLEERQAQFFSELFSLAELVKFSGKKIEIDECFSFKERFEQILEQNETSFV